MNYHNGLLFLTMTFGFSSVFSWIAVAESYEKTKIIKVSTVLSLLYIIFGFLFAVGIK